MTNWRCCSMNAHRLPPWVALVGFVAASWLAARPLRGDEKRVFRAGAHAMDITPQKFPISVNGGMQDRLAKAAHDRLHARCLVLDDGRTRIALVVVDSCMMPRDLLDK